MPFNAQAMSEVAKWQQYRPPTPHHGETVYCVTPHYDTSGRTTVALINAEGDRGIACRYSVGSLPCLTLWKNTDTMEEGYVTGIEPGTGFPFRRALEREAGRVPKLASGASVAFHLEWQLLSSAAAVKATRDEISSIQMGRPTTVDSRSQ